MSVTVARSQRPRRGRPSSFAGLVAERVASPAEEIVVICQPSTGMGWSCSSRAVQRPGESPAGERQAASTCSSLSTMTVIPSCLFDEGRAADGDGDIPWRVVDCNLPLTSGRAEEDQHSFIDKRPRAEVGVGEFRDAAKVGVEDEPGGAGLAEGDGHRQAIGQEDAGLFGLIFLALEEKDDLALAAALINDAQAIARVIREQRCVRPGGFEVGEEVGELADKRADPADGPVGGAALARLAERGGEVGSGRDKRVRRGDGAAAVEVSCMCAAVEGGEVVLPAGGKNLCQAVRDFIGIHAIVVRRAPEIR